LREEVEKRKPCMMIRPVMPVFHTNMWALLEMKARQGTKKSQSTVNKNQQKQMMEKKDENFKISSNKHPTQH
jgi:hypothetical protein